MRFEKAIGAQGFSLVWLVAVLAGLSVVAGLLVPFLFGEITVSNEDATRRQLAKLVEVIAGIPEEGTFGFIGDVGRLPKSLEELNDTAGPHTLCDSAFTPSVAAFHTADGAGNHRGKLGMGWRGPYFKEMVFSDEHLKDLWGNRFRYTCPETTKPASDPTTGGVALTVRTGQIVSAGPDGKFDTHDDIKSDQFHDRGHLFLTVTTGTAGNIPQGVTATLYFPVNGEQSSLLSQPSTVQGAETIVFASVPAGVRYAQIDHSQSVYELTHMSLRSTIVNRISLKSPTGPGGKN